MNKKMLQLRLMLCRGGVKRANLLRKKKVFFAMGEHCYWHPITVPNESYLLNIHNNVVVAANVMFVTHDVIDYMLNYKNKYDYEQYIGSIEIFDNCFVGANSTIMYNVSIGPNAVIAAGSVVTKDVPEGTIVGGNPARVIGKVEDLETKRMNLEFPTKRYGQDKIKEYFWGRG